MSKKLVTGASIQKSATGLIPAGRITRNSGTGGQKNNYNFQPGVTEFSPYPVSTIEWVAAEKKFQARVIVTHKTTGDNVVFNSWHEDFADAERAIDLVNDSLLGIGTRRVYNIWGETMETHMSDHGGGNMVRVTEVRALIWSMDRT